MSDFVRTPMTEVGKASPRPSGKVQTDGKSSPIDLPERTKSSDAIPEVLYDNNANLPERG